MLALLLAVQALPYLGRAEPVITPAARVCAAQYADLSAYQGEAYGAVTRREVDRPGGTIEYRDSVAIRHGFEVAASPYLEELRRGALDLTASQCRALNRAGKRAIQEVILRVFSR